MPTGIHLTTSPDTYKGLLRHQNASINSITVLSIKGLSENAIHQEIMVDEKQTNIGKYIMVHKGIKALEQTHKTEELGKWFLLYTKQAKQAGDDLLDNKLMTIYNTQIEHRHKIPGYCTPQRTKA
eukprot:539964-Ditylum_brightwellii.AAC.1